MLSGRLANAVTALRWMFGAKIVCEQCTKKARESKSLYRRGSRFCSEVCRDAWEAARLQPAVNRSGVERAGDRRVPALLPQGPLDREQQRTERRAIGSRD